MNILLNGSKEAEKILKNIKNKNQKNNITLVVILIGKDSASQIYINIKEKRAKELGVNFKKFLLPANTSEKNILNLINKLNNNKNIHGILVQLPLPEKFKKNTNNIIKKINKNKDIDGFNNSKIVPPTIQSIVHLIKMSEQKLENKKCAILANSNEFAKPLERELKKKKIKIDIYLKPKKDIYSKYDIVVIALGKKHWLKSEMIKKNCIVIDIGINRVGKNIYGDVHPECFKKSKYISPVPGGVGPLTVAFLFKNLITLANYQ